MSRDLGTILVGKDAVKQKDFTMKLAGIAEAIKKTETVINGRLLFAEYI